MRILGIETSCDETSVAIYDTEKGLLSHIIYTQLDVHARFGGIVPEQASRDHLRKLLPIIDQALNESGLDLKAINAVAYTKGPGLVGALLVGAILGRSLAFALDVPAVGVHHLEGHLLASFLEDNPPAFPYLALLVSGGHTELVKVAGIGQYHIIGETLDDAAGEAFDKTARLLGLGYPGGAALAALAEKGDPKRFRFPRPMVDRPGLDMSFSGLKTFALNTVNRNPKDEQCKADIARAFQDAVVETLAIKCRRGLKETGLKRLVIAGGVAANKDLRQTLKVMCDKQEATLYFPRQEFCTDNGAMIAYVGAKRIEMGQSEDLAVTVNPRWSLEDF